MSNSLAWIDDELHRLDQLQLRRRLVSRTGGQSGEIVINGQRLLNFGSNDYLGLAADSRLREAAETTIRRGGWGSGASPLVTGRTALHAELEKKLAAFEGAEAALLFPTGYAANVGTISVLVGKGDVIFSDQKNHASIIDGCRLSGARTSVYPHNDITALEASLQTASDSRRRLIVTDGLFSMDGDYARIPQLVELAGRYDAMVMVDEAHATGVCGTRGRGVCELHEMDEAVPIRVGTLSKGLGSVGGFVVGSQSLIDWLTNRARTYVFSTAFPAAAASAGLAALGVIRDEPHRRTELLSRSSRLRAALKEQGWRIPAGESQIIPVIVGSPKVAIQVSTELREAGIFVPGIRPPSVPEGESLLRISLSYEHTSDQLGALESAFAAHRGVIR